MHRTLAKSLERVHMGDESGGVTARRLRIAGIVTHSAHCSVRLELARMPICSLLNTKSSRGGLSPPLSLAYQSRTRNERQSPAPFYIY